MSDGQEQAKEQSHRRLIKTIHRFTNTTINLKYIYIMRYWAVMSDRYDQAKEQSRVDYCFDLYELGVNYRSSPRVCVCVHARACVRVRGFVRARACACVRVRACVCVCVCVHACVRACACACACACVRARVRACGFDPHELGVDEWCAVCVRACECACEVRCVCACVRVCLRACEDKRKWV